MSSIQVRMAEVATRHCSCVNATPNSVSVMAHSDKCGYRLFLEAIDKIDRLSGSEVTLRPLILKNYARMFRIGGTYCRGPGLQLSVDDAYKKWSRNNNSISDTP